MKLTKVNLSHWILWVSLSYVVGIATSFAVLYTGGLFGHFVEASFLLLTMMVLSAAYLCLTQIMSLGRILRVPSSIRDVTLREAVIATLLVFGALMTVYVIILSARAVMDSDVAQDYLPIAQEIVRSNALSYNSGFDFNVFLKPIGVSVLYAWVTEIAGSSAVEAFRLLPLVPVSIMVGLVYFVALRVANAYTAWIAALVFMLLPVQDRLLLYNGFYPDTYYYPMIFLICALLLDYSLTRQDRLWFWAGLTLGVASLLKAQTIYSLVAVAAVLVMFEGKGRRTGMVIFAAIPFAMYAPDLLSSSVRSNGFALTLPSFDATQIILLLIMSVFAGGLAYWAFPHLSANEDSRVLRRLFKLALFVGVPLIAISSLWYLTNIIKFGTLIYTSSLELPNYGWALGVVQGSGVVSLASPLGLPGYLGLFLFMPFDPAVAGYVWLVPIVVGFGFLVAKRSKAMVLLFLMEAVFSVALLSQVTFGISAGASVYNTRDIIALAPFLATLAALGIVWLMRSTPRMGLLTVLVTAGFGFVSYVQSVFVQFLAGLSTGGLTVHAFQQMASSFGLSLAQLSLQLSVPDRIPFISSHWFQLLAIGWVASAPLILLGPLARHILAHPIGFTFPSVLRHGPVRVLKVATILLLISSVVLIVAFPRFDAIQVQGGIGNMSNFEIAGIYPTLSRLALTPFVFNGSILTYGLPGGLNYYLHTGVVDLAYPANLAFLETILTSPPPQAILGLKKLNITYLLFDISSLGNIDMALNHTLSEVMNDPRLSKVVSSLGSWNLYLLGPFNTSTIPLGTQGWSIYKIYANSTYQITNGSVGLTLQLAPWSPAGRVDIVEQNVTRYGLSDFDYLLLKLNGTSNARIVFRIWFTDNTSQDIVYWGTLLQASVPFSLGSLAGKVVRGDIYLFLESSDGMPASVTIGGAYLIKMLP